METNFVANLTIDHKSFICLQLDLNQQPYIARQTQTIAQGQ